MKFGDPAITFVYHLGVHCTDDDMLMRSLLRDGVALQERNVIVPRPRRYRKTVKTHMAEHRGDPMPDDVQQAFYDEVMRGYPAERVVLGDQDYLTLPQAVFEGQQLYSKAGFRTAWLRYLFPENPCEFFLAIRNPATYLPAALNQKSMPSYEKFVNGTDPLRMRWSGVVERIQKNNPGCPITVWCNEDTPLIWPQILRAITGTEASYPFQGDNDVVRSIMTEEGYEKMEAFLASMPPESEEQRQKVIAAFFDKFALEDEMEEEIDLPGWSPDLIDQVSDLYDADVEDIAGMDGVTLISS